MGWIFGLCDVGSPIFNRADQAFEIADLIAQKQMACWAGYAFFTTAVGVIVSAFALVGLFRSLGQTERALKETRELGEAGVRAYVHVSEAKHVWERAQAPYYVLLFLENVGQTPAKIFQVGGTIERVLQGQVSSAIKPKRYRMKTWSGLRPGQPVTTVRLDVPELADLAAEFTNPIENQYILVQGTVRYQDIFDQWYETDFAFYSHTTTPKGSERLTKLRRPTATKLRSYEPVPAPKASGTD